MTRALCRIGRPAAEDLARLVVDAGLEATAVERMADTAVALELRATTAQGEIRATIRLPGTAGQRTRITSAPPSGGPGYWVLAQADGRCRLDLGRIVEQDGAQRLTRLVEYTGDPPAPSRTEALNPPVPDGTDPGGVAVATIDSGVAYTLAAIGGRLARDGDGRSLGRDFHEDDDRPFDLDPSRPPIFPIHHGTAVASILLREAPEARLVPLRYPAGAPDRFADAVAYVARTPARIVSMALGGAARSEWEPFAKAARRHPEILFVVSAGNDGRDIDAQPVYPAAFDLGNLLVVTSTDAFGRLARESNWGARSVDIAVPGERIDVIDHRGARGKASGTSYAVPRVAALAARMKARHPDWDAARIKAEILKLAVTLDDAARPIAAGWIPNPAIE